jgi:Holliday junction resolvase
VCAFLLVIYAVSSISFEIKVSKRIKILVEGEKVMKMLIFINIFGGVLPCGDLQGNVAN